MCVESEKFNGFGTQFIVHVSCMSGIILEGGRVVAVGKETLYEAQIYDREHFPSKHLERSLDTSALVKHDGRCE